MSDFNKQVIEEFRENEGKVGGYFEDATVLLLHTIGAKSGNKRVNPVVTLIDDDNYIVIASAAGADSHPAWYHNIVANPEFDVEVGTEKFAISATITDEPERSDLYAKMVAINPGFAEYETKTSRVIPVIVLNRA